MALIQNWLPPSRENWELVVYLFQFFPVFTLVQWFTAFYPAGKTSLPSSRFNINGHLAWFLMEIPGTITLLYCMFTVPPLAHPGLTPRKLPWGNWTMAACFTIHYTYRAVLAPLWLNPSMSPIHAIVFVAAFGWQVTNGLSIGGWLAGYGPVTQADWADRAGWIFVGLVTWGWGLLGNIFHDDDLREIRRAAMRRQRAEGKKGDRVDKVYLIPRNGLFHFVLYAHYFCEWIEWTGFWMVGGLGCVPARNFLFNEVATMLPRAVGGRRWYLEKFGEQRVGGRKAVVPGII